MAHYRQNKITNLANLRWIFNLNIFSKRIWALIWSFRGLPKMINNIKFIYWRDVIKSHRSVDEIEPLNYLGANSIHITLKNTRKLSNTVAFKRVTKILKSWFSGRVLELRFRDRNDLTNRVVFKIQILLLYLWIM